MTSQQPTEKQEEPRQGRHPSWQGWIMTRANRAHRALQQWHARYKQQSAQDRAILVTAWATAVMAALTAVAVGVAWMAWEVSSRQLHAMNRQLAAMEAQLKQAEQAMALTNAQTILAGRALLVIESFDLTKETGGENFAGRIKWKNVGNTPANYVRAIVNVGSTDKPRSTEDPFNNLPDSKVTKAYVGATREVVQTFAVPGGDVVAVFNRTKHLYVWGWVEFDDLWPTTPTHRVVFCYQIFFDADATGESVTGRAEQYDDYNLYSEVKGRNGRPRDKGSPQTEADDPRRAL